MLATPKLQNTQNQREKLINSLANLPPWWKLVPVNGNKQPLGYQWQHYPFSPKQMLLELSTKGYIEVLGRNNLYPVYPQGYGILLGNYQTHYLIALDLDGYSTLKLLKAPLPPTITFSSGRPGRCQYLFTSKIPIISRRITTTSGEALEIRSTGQMSVLPPSPHPLTGGYQWVPGCSPDVAAIAPIPDWLIELSNQEIKSPPQWTKPVINSPRPRNCQTSPEYARFLLSQIHPRFADNYDTWIKIGMALHDISFALLTDWDNWSQLSCKYILGECHYKWASFKGQGITDRTLFWYANQN